MKPIPACRGFALEREIEGETGTTFISTWVGFRGQKHPAGEKRPSTEWPIQRCIWSDYGMQPGQNVRYRVIPMVGPSDVLEKAQQSEWSSWTDWISIGTGQTKNFKAYFNRGIIPAQWLAR